MVQLHAYLPSLISTECFESQGSAIHYMKHLAQKGCSIGVCGENERAYLGHMIHISSYLKLQLLPIIFERGAKINNIQHRSKLLPYPDGDLAHAYKSNIHVPNYAIVFPASWNLSFLSSYLLVIYDSLSVVSYASAEQTWVPTSSYLPFCPAHPANITFIWSFNYLFISLYTTTPWTSGHSIGPTILEMMSGL